MADGESSSAETEEDQQGPALEPVLLAVPSDDAAGRLDERMVTERAPSVRSEAERDRDRVLYCSHFLRLGHVTQVAAPELGHTFHSRLIHSLKVGQVARGVAERLRSEAGRMQPASRRLVGFLDPYAAEAAALAHDLGHPPFGHLAETELNDKARYADFEGNAQSFRIVTRLALRAADPDGLNLTRRTLNGILKYPWLRDTDDDKKNEKWGAYRSEQRYFDWVRVDSRKDEKSLEAQLMDWADDVTYAVHDMDDFFRVGLIPLDRLINDESERAEFEAHLKTKGPDDGAGLRSALDRLLDLFVSVRSPFSGRSDQRVELRSLTSNLISRYIAAVELEDHDESIVELRIAQPIRDEVLALKQLTWFYVIERPSLSVMQKGQGEIISKLFETFSGAAFAGDIHFFPAGARERALAARTDAAKERAVIDLIAGLTESGCSELYRQRVGVAAGSILTRASGSG